MNSKMIYWIAGIILVAAALIVFFVYRSNTAKAPAQTADNSQSTTQSSQTSTAVKTGDCTKEPQKDANGIFQPTVDIANKTALLQTSQGNIEIQLFDKDAPKTVQNFVCLIQKGYYNGITFHRIAHAFMIQTGDPTGTGSGGQSIWGHSFEDELNPSTASYKTGYIKGTVAMANTGRPGSNGSQFFIMVGDVPLPPAYTIFGKVSAGLDVAEKIGAMEIIPGPLGDGSGAPKTPVLINKAIIK